jgi:DNA mismatch repair protein MSH2
MSTVLKSEMDNIENKIQKVLRKAADDLGMEAGKSIKLELNPRIGYLFRITLNEEKNIRNNKSYTVVSSIKGGIRFRNKNLEILSDEYLSKKNSYTSQQKMIVAEIVETAGS